MTLFSKLRSIVRHHPEDPRDLITDLLLAAKEDDGLRSQMLFLLRAPSVQRESLVNTALHEMELRGEPKDARVAFATLATEEGAKTALNILEMK